MVRFVEATILGALSEIVAHYIFFLSTHEASKRELGYAVRLCESLTRAATTAYEGRAE